MKQRGNFLSAPAGGAPDRESGIVPVQGDPIVLTGRVTHATPRRALVRYHLDGSEDGVAWSELASADRTGRGVTTLVAPSGRNAYARARVELKSALSIVRVSAEITFGKTGEESASR